MDLESLRMQLDLIQIDTPQTKTLADGLLLLLGAVETLQHRVGELEDTNPEAHMPEECQQHECSYFTHYLAYGGPDLTHEGYHQAEENCTRAQKLVEDWYEEHGGNYRLTCPYEKQATYWEKAVRA